MREATITLHCTIIICITRLEWFNCFVLFLRQLGQHSSGRRPEIVRNYRNNSILRL